MLFLQNHVQTPWLGELGGWHGLTGDMYHFRCPNFWLFGGKPQKNTSKTQPEKRSQHIFSMTSKCLKTHVLRNLVSRNFAFQADGDQSEESRGQGATGGGAGLARPSTWLEGGNRFRCFCWRVSGPKNMVAEIIKKKQILWPFNSWNSLFWWLLAELRWVFVGYFCWSMINMEETKFHGLSRVETCFTVSKLMSVEIFQRLCFGYDHSTIGQEKSGYGL